MLAGNQPRQRDPKGTAQLLASRVAGHADLPLLSVTHERGHTDDAVQRRDATGDQPRLVIAALAYTACGCWHVNQQTLMPGIGRQSQERCNVSRRSLGSPEL